MIYKTSMIPLHHTMNEQKIPIIAITDAGCEAACAQECARILDLKSNAITTMTQSVQFTCTWDEAVRLAYRVQTALRVLVRIAPHTQTIDELTEQPFDKSVIAQMLPEQGTFKAECELYDPSLMPQEIIEGIGEWIFTAGVPVSLSKPDLIVVGLATADGIDVGVDLVGWPLWKRDWRVMLSSRSIKGTIAASVAVYAGLLQKHTVLDPFGDDGSLAIEATMLLTGASPRRHARAFSFTRFPVLKDLGWNTLKVKLDKDIEEDISVTAFSDTLRDTKSVRTNAKLAGIDKFLYSTKVGMDWTDMKTGEESIDRIVTAPIASGKVISPARAVKLADQLFWQAEFVLKKTGTVTCITEKPEELAVAAKEHGFTLGESHDVRMGQRSLTIVTYKKGPKKKK